MTGDANIDLARTAVGIVNTQGSAALLERYDELFTEDFRWTPALVGRIEGRKEYRGRQGLADYWRDFEAIFSRLEVRDFEFTAVGEKTVWVSGTGHFVGTESGVPLEQRLGWAFRFEGGKLAAGETFFSPEDAQAAAERWVHA